MSPSEAEREQLTAEGQRGEEDRLAAIREELTRHIPACCVSKERMAELTRAERLLDEALELLGQGWRSGRHNLTMENHATHTLISNFLARPEIAKRVRGART